MNESRNGDFLEASDLLDILEVFGEDGKRSYLMGIIEGQADASEGAADEDVLIEEYDEDDENEA